MSCSRAAITLFLSIMLVLTGVPFVFGVTDGAGAEWHSHSHVHDGHEHTHWHSHAVAEHAQDESSTLPRLTDGGGHHDISQHAGNSRVQLTPPRHRYDEVDASLAAAVALVDVGRPTWMPSPPMSLIRPPPDIGPDPLLEQLQTVVLLI